MQEGSEEVRGKEEEDVEEALTIKLKLLIFLGTKRTEWELGRKEDEENDEKGEEAKRCLLIYL